ncbi:MULTISPECIES: 2-amino-4-hydroxy-6-hydroxymethyldihydropteridine diphosphokinase [Rheinheimera]|uniref:2-amino-4-hydroxy-6- hydroxymethyldihydropteridine diphosphokinase n=1 Tax=Rheinheimera TaxID=67575 RepID=UPI001E419993|nr:2-amino-4-hydroxy-6-hydroxymethyldihydropteridine diphosphokinase [Rheinheimera aquimaris]MCD1600271.1 2-amino-4-hydroxy-6-hydroxymethyldihydropteridine diphosphokinase [Rheinheimera aquimaris]
MARIYISIGSNIDRQFHIQAAVSALQQHFGAVQLSSVYESEAVGFSGDAFYNLVACADTDLPIADCVALFKQIEDSYGRDRSAQKFSGRTLDLDLLTYDDVVCQQPVELPRAEITENAFVLWPLAELAPDRLHPKTGVSYAGLWQQYEKKQKLWPVPFEWSAQQ